MKQEEERKTRFFVENDVEKILEKKYTSDPRFKFDSGLIYINQSQFFAMHSKQ